MWWWTEKVTILAYCQAFRYDVMEIVINKVFIIRIVSGYLHQIASDVRFNYLIFDDATGRAFLYFVTKYDNCLTIMTFKSAVHEYQTLEFEYANIAHLYKILV